MGRSSHKGREILLNKKMRELNVANCFEYSLLCFMLNINLTFFNITKSSVDGDRSQEFWITQKLQPLSKKYEKEFSLKKVAISQEKKLLREVKVAIYLATINFGIFFLWLFFLWSNIFFSFLEKVIKCARNSIKNIMRKHVRNTGNTQIKWLIL